MRYFAILGLVFCGIVWLIVNQLTAVRGSSTFGNGTEWFHSVGSAITSASSMLNNEQLQLLISNDFSWCTGMDVQTGSCEGIIVFAEPDTLYFFSKIQIGDVQDPVDIVIVGKLRYLIVDGAICYAFGEGLQDFDVRVVAVPDTPTSIVRDHSYHGLRRLDRDTEVAVAKSYYKHLGTSCFRVSRLASGVYRAETLDRAQTAASQFVGLVRMIDSDVISLQNGLTTQ